MAEAGASLPLRVLSQNDIRRLLTYERCIPLIRDAMIQVSQGSAVLPMRHAMPLPDGRGMMGLMYGYLGAPAAFGVKLGSFFPHNKALGLSSHMGLMVLFEGREGRPVAVMDSGALTAIRTAAASAVATDAMARPDARVLAVFGAGEQAAAHIQAIAQVRPIERIRVWARDPAKAAAFVEEKAHTVDAEMQAIASCNEAAASDIICTTTGAAEPILFGRDVKPGTHVNLVGSSFADKAEADTELMLKGRYIVDFRPSALAQAGEFLRAKAAGALQDDYIVAEIGEVLSGRVQGRTSADDITLYKSLGVAAQDLAAASALCGLAVQQDIGVLATI